LEESNQQGKQTTATNPLELRPKLTTKSHGSLRKIA